MGKLPEEPLIDDAERRAQAKVGKLVPVEDSSPPQDFRRRVSVKE